MKKILVPVDFSDNSLKAAFYAAEIANKFEGTIYLLHVLELGHEKLYQPFTFRDKYNNLVISDSEKELKKWDEIIRRRFDKLQVVTEVVHGTPADRIIEYAHDVQAGMIILGNTGAGKATRLVFGSVTDKLIAHAPIPVVAVPPEAAVQLPDNIIFATSHFERDRLLLQPVIDLVQQHQATLHIVFFMDRDVDPAFYHTGYALKIENYKEFMKSNYPDISTVFNIIEGSDFETSVEDYIKTNDADMLVMVPYNHGLFAKVKSSTRTMACRSSVPVLILPLSQEAAKPVAAAKANAGA